MVLISELFRYEGITVEIINVTPYLFLGKDWQICVHHQSRSEMKRDMLEVQSVEVTGVRVLS